VVHESENLQEDKKNYSEIYIFSILVFLTYSVRNDMLIMSDCAIANSKVK
jgi:hypothetical protein